MLPATSATPIATPTDPSFELGSEFLEHAFPLRAYSGPGSVPLQKMKDDETPIPGLKMPKGAKLERGTAEMPAAKAAEGDVSVAALAKRVLADQMFM